MPPRRSAKRGPGKRDTVKTEQARQAKRTVEPGYGHRGDRAA